MLVPFGTDNLTEPHRCAGVWLVTSCTIDQINELEIQKAGVDLCNRVADRAGIVQRMMSAAVLAVVNLHLGLIKQCNR
jgi:hypothetical protein